MGRPDRTDPAAGSVPDSVSAMTEELRAQIERQVQDVAVAAQARAAEIEEAAQRRADETERRAQERAGGVLRQAHDQASRLLRAIDALEGDMGEIVASLRSEAHALSSELEAALPGLEAGDRRDAEAPAPRPAAWEAELLGEHPSGFRGRLRRQHKTPQE